MKVRKKNNKIAKYDEFTGFILGTFFVCYSTRKVEGMSGKIKNILDSKRVTVSDIKYLLSSTDRKECETLKNYSNTITSEVSKNYYNSEENIKISNHCNADCLFCEFRQESEIERFRLNREEIIDKSVEFYKSGYKSIFIHSTYDDFYDTDRIAYIIYSIKKKANIKITLSLGVREINEYKKWKIAGADSYFLSFITGDNKLYKVSKAWSTLETRVSHIKELKRLGYNVGTGSVLGLPNQTIESVAEDIFFAKNLNTDFINFCKYNNGKSEFNDMLIKRTLDVAQIVIPKSKIGIKHF